MVKKYIVDLSQDLRIDSQAIMCNGSKRLKTYVLTRKSKYEGLEKHRRCADAPQRDRTLGVLAETTDSGPHLLDWLGCER